MKSIDDKDGFYQTMKKFEQNAEPDVMSLLKEEKRIMALVKSAGDYFHRNAKRDEGFRLFVIVRDFLVILDKNENQESKQGERGKNGNKENKNGEKEEAGGSLLGEADENQEENDNEEEDSREITGGDGNVIHQNSEQNGSGNQESEGDEGNEDTENDDNNEEKDDQEEDEE
ncbi:Formin-like protein 5 [Capsicum chinense]|nr:Formin-like protein 5 [Capsicum chinense]